MSAADGTCTVKELAKILAASQEELLTLVKDGVISEKSKGRFVPLQAVAEYIKYLRRMPSAGTMVDGDLCVSFGQMVKILGCVESTLVRYVKRGCPQVDKGVYSVRAVFEWLQVCSMDVQSGEDGEPVFKSLAEQKQYYEAELKKAQVEEREIKNAISRGDYIPKTEIVEELKRVLVVLKKSLKGFSRKVASEISYKYGADEARQAERFVSDLTNNALEQLCIDGVYDARKTAT